MKHSIKSNTRVNTLEFTVHWTGLSHMVFIGFQMRMVYEYFSKQDYFFSGVLRDIFSLCFYIPVGIRAFHQEKSPRLF